MSTPFDRAMFARAKQKELTRLTHELNKRHDFENRSVYTAIWSEKLISTYKENLVAKNLAPGKTWDL